MALQDLFQNNPVLLSGINVGFQMNISLSVPAFSVMEGGIAETVNRAKPSGKELDTIFRGHIAEDTLVLTDGLRSYHVLETLANCTVVDINREESRGIFNLNTVNSLHSFIKETYNHYRGVATKYINRYNALFSIAFRCVDNLKDILFSSLCTMGQNCYWHSTGDVRNYQLLLI